MSRLTKSKDAARKAGASRDIEPMGEVRHDMDRPSATRTLAIREEGAGRQDPETRTNLPVRPLAGFVTQLLACRDGVPEYRTRRRAEPEAAAASYEDVSVADAPAIRHATRLERVL
jgi:hypothetical protein